MKLQPRDVDTLATLVRAWCDVKVEKARWRRRRRMANAALYVGAAVVAFVWLAMGGAQ